MLSNLWTVARPTLAIVLFLVIAIAFDAASATTGPANIPILLGLTIGLSQASEGIDPIRFGFGLIACTAYGTTAAILILGILGGR